MEVDEDWEAYLDSSAVGVVETDPDAGLEGDGGLVNWMPVSFEALLFEFHADLDKKRRLV